MRTTFASTLWDYFCIDAVVTAVVQGEGAKQLTLENIKELGTNVVSIYSSWDFFNGIRTLVLAEIPKRWEGLCRQRQP